MNIVEENNTTKDYHYRYMNLTMKLIMYYFESRFHSCL